MLDTLMVSLRTSIQIKRKLSQFEIEKLSLTAEWKTVIVVLKYIMWFQPVSQTYKLFMP